MLTKEITDSKKENAEAEEIWTNVKVVSNKNSSERNNILQRN